MSISPRQRHVALALALGATLLAVRWTAGREAELQEAAASPVAAVLPAQAAVPAGAVDSGDSRGAGQAGERPVAGEALPVLELDRLQRPSRDEADASPTALFAGKPPPPAAPVVRRPAPPPTPVAPALPFAYQGKVTEAGQTVVFLSASGRNYLARAGDLLDSAWRVEEIGERSMILTYLPLNSRHQLSTGTAK